MFLIVHVYAFISYSCPQKQKVLIVQALLEAPKSSHIYSSWVLEQYPYTFSISSHLVFVAV